MTEMTRVEFKELEMVVPGGIDGDGENLVTMAVMAATGVMIGMGTEVLELVLVLVKV